MLKFLEKFLKLVKKLILQIVGKKKTKRRFYLKLKLNMLIRQSLEKEVVLFCIYLITSLLFVIKIIYVEILQTIKLILTYNYFLKYKEIRKLDTFFIDTFFVFLYNS